MGAIFSARNYSKKITGNGSPEGNRTGMLNTLYEDTVSGDVYLKTSTSGVNGWKVLDGGGGSGGAVVIDFVAGDSGGPVPGSTVFSSAALVGKSVDYIIANNIFELAIGPQPAFSFNPVTGSIDRAPNVWYAGDTLLIQFR